MTNLSYRFTALFGLRSESYDPTSRSQSQRSLRKFSFRFQLSPAKKKQWDAGKGRKLKLHALRAIVSRTIFNSLCIKYFLHIRRIVLYVRRPSCPPVFLEDQRQIYNKYSLRPLRTRLPNEIFVELISSGR